MNSVHCNIATGNLSAEEISIVESRMYPGKYSKAGFLAEDEKLLTVIEQDRQTIQYFDITYEQIADILKYIEIKYRKSGLKTALIDEKYQVSSFCPANPQECPFQNQELDDYYHGHDYGNINLTVKNVTTGKTIIFGNLLVHLIRAHHFFEGPKSPYRLDPVDVIELFDLKPGVVYTPKYKTIEEWCNLSSVSRCMYGKEDIDILCSVCLGRYDIGVSGILCILLPCPRINNIIKYAREKGSTFEWISYFYDRYEDDRKVAIDYNLFDDDIILTDKEICQEISDEIEKIEQRDIKSMYLLVLNLTKEVQCFTSIIEGIKLKHIDNHITMETIYMYRSYNEFV